MKKYGKAKVLREMRPFMPVTTGIHLTLPRLAYSGVLATTVILFNED